MILQHIRALRSHNSSYIVTSITACKQPLHWRGTVYSKSWGTGRKVGRDRNRVINNDISSYFVIFSTHFHPQRRNLQNILYGLMCRELQCSEPKHICTHCIDMNIHNFPHKRIMYSSQCVRRFKFINPLHISSCWTCSAFIFCFYVKCNHAYMQVDKT